MEQLKQILQLKDDGIGIREIARRTGICRNSVRKYLLLLKADSEAPVEEMTNKALADKAYSSDVTEYNECFVFMKGYRQLFYVTI